MNAGWMFSSAYFTYAFLAVGFKDMSMLLAFMAKFLLHDESFLSLGVLLEEDLH